MKELRIGIAGLGTVGVGTYQILTEKAELFKVRTGCDITVTVVASRTPDKDRGVDLSGISWVSDTMDLATHPDVDVVLELIGGEEGIAYNLCKAALRNGKHVVTANKALIAKHGAELVQLAADQNVHIGFEAAVAGGIPVLKSLRESLAANKFTQISGIMNGTCNYILSSMEREGRDFDDVLAEAQAKGYAETPPDLDVDGIDAAHKLCIITSLAYGVKLDFDAIAIQGIREVNARDMEYAKELGYTIRLLGITAETERGIEQRVQPCLVKLGSSMASIHGPQNAILVECDSVGPALLTGAGAGAGPTGSSVVADIIDIARENFTPPLGVPASSLKQAPFVNAADQVGAFYIRFKVEDRSGVLADITKRLSEAGINVDQVLQKPPIDESHAHIALTVDMCRRGDIDQLLAELAETDYVLEQPHLMAVE